MVGPFEHLPQQFINAFAPMIPRDRLVQAPPHPLDRIRLRSPLRKKVQLDPMAPGLQVLTHGPAIVEAGVVADHMNHPEPPEPTPEIIQVRHEQGRVPSPRWSAQDQPPCPVDQRPGQMPLVIVSGSDDLRLLAFDHPLAADLGVQVDVDFILEHGRLLSRQMAHQMPDSLAFQVVCGIVEFQDRPGATPDEIHVAHAVISYRRQR